MFFFDELKALTKNFMFDFWLCASVQKLTAYHDAACAFYTLDAIAPGAQDTLGFLDISAIF